jgi:hypothetical protein
MKIQNFACRHTCWDVIRLGIKEKVLTRQRSRLSYCATNRKVAGSSFINLPNCSSRTKTRGLLSLYKNEYQKRKKCFWGVEHDRRVGLIISPSSVSRLFRQSWILNISQPYRPPRPVTGITLLCADGVCFL